MNDNASLQRIRWGVRGALTLGVTVSVIANVLHAVDNPISQAIAAWPPLALLLTVELISRIPVHSRALGVARILATTIIAGIAAWVSYWHMAGVASRYGENGAAPYLIPISVDGLIVVASICLIELGGRLQKKPAPELMNVDAEISRLEAVLAEQQHADALTIEQTQDWDIAEIADVPVSPAPAGRKTRATWDASVVIPQIIDGVKKADIDVPGATYYRLVKVAKLLKADPRADIDFQATKVSPEHVHAMRELVGR